MADLGKKWSAGEPWSVSVKMVYQLKATGFSNATGKQTFYFSRMVYESRRAARAGIDEWVSGLEAEGGAGKIEKVDIIELVVSS